jgi:DNA-binding NarL/FixJ family response regulator
VRVGLKQLFSQCDEIDVCEEVSNGGQVLEALRKSAYDLLLLDIAMPGINGLDLISRISLRYPSQRILIFSMHKETNMVSRALKAGAHGYISKDSEPNALIMAVRTVAGGGRFLDPSLGVQIVFDIDEANSPSSDSLTDREFGVLRMLVRGLKVSEIAEELSISNKTVSTHKNRIMKKLDVDNNAELIRYAIQNGLG